MRLSPSLDRESAPARARRRLTAAATAGALALATALPAGVVLATGAAAAPDDPGLGDLARDAVVTASASQDDQDGAFPPGLATDGDPATRWASGNGPDEDVEWPQWYQLDLGEVSDLDSLRLAWEAAYATDFTVAVADADPADEASWEVVHTETDGPGGTEVVDLPDGTDARYVRLDMTGRAAATWEAPTLHWYGYSLFSVEVWGTAPTPTVGFAGSATAVDAGEPVSVPVRLGQPRDVDTTVHVTSTDGSATAGEDYAAVDADVVVPAGETTATVETTTTDNGPLAGDRTFTLEIADAPDGTRLGARAEHTVTVRAHGDLPNDGARIPLDDFESETLPVFAWGADAGATPVLTRVEATREGVPAGSHALSAQVAAIGAGGWGGFSHDFATVQDWSGAGGFSFWFLGTGSGDDLRYELKSGGGSAGAATLFEESVVDDSEGWREVEVTFAELRVKGDPSSATRFDPAVAWGYAVTLSDLGTGTWLFDDVSLVENAATIMDFEGDVPLSTDTNPVGVFAWGQSEATKPTLEVTQDDRDGQAASDNHVLSGTYQVPSGAWGGFSHNLATPQDWSGYGGLRFWWYASQDSRPASPTAGADIRVELKDDGPDGEHSELYWTTFKDNWSEDGSRWKLVELPFSQFAKRGDYQPGPAEIQDGVLSLERAWGYALTMPTDTAPTGYKVDHFQVYGSPAPAVVATVAPTPSVVLVEPGETAAVDVTLTTSDGGPLAEDVTVTYGPGEGGTAVAGEDYEDFGGTLTFAAGAESGAVQSAEVVTLDDGEPGEAVTVPVALDATGAAVTGDARVVLNASGLPYLDESLPADERVADLVGRMTLEEKVGQMAQAERLGLASPDDISSLGLGSLLSGGGSVPTDNTPSGWADMVDGYQREALTTRWQIPMIYGVDAVHGHNNVVGATLFPHNIGLGASRDPALVQEAAEVTATEVRATGIPWTFASCLCVTRDERWGRSYESFGEDPALVKAFAAATVVGLQGDDPTDMSGPSTVLSTPKHWVGDGGTTYDESVTGSGYPIDQGITEVASEDELRRLHIDPYVPAIEAGAGSVMPSYSAVSVDGGAPVRMHENAHLNNDVLKGELGFDGFMVSDWEGIDKLPGGTYPEKAVRAVNAGVDMAMAPYNYDDFIAAIEAAVDAGTVSEERVDDAVTRILRQKFAVGLFEQPFADRTNVDEVGSDAHRGVARRAAAESQVLLKNDGVLPLAGDANVYVAGSTADDLGRQLGGWSISWQGSSGAITDGTTIGDAVAAASTGDVTVSPDASAPMDGADVGVVVVGEKPYAEGVGDVRYGAGSQFSLSLTAQDQATIDTVCGAMDCVVLVVSGRPQLVADQLDDMDALVASWLPGTEGSGVADVLFGAAPFTGRLPVTWPVDDDHTPENVGDADYDPQFAYGWGLRTDTPRDRLAGVVGDLDGAAASTVQAVLDADVWTDDGAIDPGAAPEAMALLQAAGAELREAEPGTDAWTAADAVVSVARDVAQGAVVDGTAAEGHAVLTSDAENALLSGEPGTAVRLLAAVVGVELPESGDLPGEDGPAVSVEVSPRCLAGKAYVAVRVVNDDDVPVAVRIETPFGSKEFAAVQPGKNAYQSFASRGTVIVAGSVDVTATAGDDATDVTTPYAALACG
ncbi:glycoside hydrolase family 3 C-terminal domain-containing protein [Cellulosimicrobium terreum]|nr:glycoside hydrolase family 3 C-terminal domain-containing protein [Cellulosimicrobium terreum]